MGKPERRFDAGMRMAAARADQRERARQRRHAGFPRRPKPEWPPGAVLVATLFHMVGAHNLAEEGRVYWTMGPIVYALLMVGPIALFWRRRAPVVVLVVAAAASLVFAAGATQHFTYAAAPAIALFTLSRLGRWRTAAIGAVAGFVAWLSVVVVFADQLGLPAGTRPDLRLIVLAALGLTGSVVFGMASKVHHEHLAEIKKARAEQARAEEEQERRQASEERLRIARELHDVLGHHLSLINVQAGVGLHLMDNRPEQAREALTAIKSASAEALREVRAVLGVLRTEGEAAPRQPALGLNRLDELTAGAGIPVRTVVNGEPRELPAEVDRAAYRIVQEALTNVRRHAGGPDRGAEVTVGYLPTALHLSVRNGGDPAGAPPAADGERGSGIAGMRARVEALGGRFAAGRLPEGGFLVSVILPAASGAAGPAASEGAGPAASEAAEPECGPVRVSGPEGDA
ncbi:histidine kinase [Actinoplanes sp. NBC_00393]|uniref:sensor histidine kinase n=1 Tax=Actinoplanes sp. NBC_00393 TaxID=2975953 RepID=UPI002E1EF0D3